MTAEPKTIPDFSSCTAPTANDTLLGCGNAQANTFKYQIGNLLGNTANVMVKTSLVLIANHSTPANSIVNTYPNGSIWFSNTRIYVALANGFIMRSPALESF